MLTCHGRSRRTANTIRTMTFDRPQWTPCRVSTMAATWMKYREDLEDLVLAHPRIFPGYRKGDRDFDDPGGLMNRPGRKTDCWGTVWDNVERGLSSHPVAFPLADWADFDAYQPPDPITDDFLEPRRPWEETRAALAAAKARGNLAQGGGLPHGFMYMRLFYLRGFENLMMDMALADPRLPRLIRMVEDYNLAVIAQYVACGAETMRFGDDLGLQDRLPMGPALWRTYVGPAYRRILSPCREADVPVYLHTDGHVLEVIPDLIEAGVRVINPQIGANGLEGLREIARGKVCIDLDLDRQFFPFATPAQIENHIGEAYEALYLPEGGLMLFAECEPDVPLENIEAICSTLERICNPPEPDPAGA